MTFSKAMALSALRKWKAAQVFIDSYSFALLPENLHLLFGPPESFFDPHDFGLEGNKERLVPILCVVSEETVLFDDPDTNSLVLISVAGPDVREIFFYWSQFVAYFLLQLLENGIEEDQVRRAAEIMEVSSIDDTVAFWKHLQVLPDRDKELIKQQFIRSFCQ